MLHRFTPDLYLDTVYDIDIADLRKKGIRAVLCDIDNTLAPYSVAAPTQSVLAWYARLHENGISVAFISNNDERRVSLFNKDTGFPAYPKSRKPFARAMRDAMKTLGVSRAETAVIGDQIFTDVCAGRAVGAYCILVKPIKDKTDPFTRFKRLLERPLLAAYRRNTKN